MKKIIFGLLLSSITKIALSQVPLLDWTKQLKSNDICYGLSVVTDHNSNIITTGYYSGIVDFDPNVGTVNMSNGLGSDTFILKLDSAGNFSWVKQFNCMDANGSSVGMALCVDKVGNIYVTGPFSTTLDFDPGSSVFSMTAFDVGCCHHDVYIVKLDPAGNFLWAKQLGGVIEDGVTSMVVDDIGNVYTTGFFSGTADFDPGSGVYNLSSSGSGSDAFISKLDANGNFVWVKQIGASRGTAITLDRSENVYITGIFGSTMDFDPGLGVYNLNASGSTDIFILKLTSTGNFIWAQQKGSTGVDVADGIKTDANNNIYLAGAFSGTVDFDPGAATYGLTSLYNQDIFVTKADSMGNFIWAKQMEGNNMEEPQSLFVDRSNNVYTTGYFTGITDFDPGPSVHSFTSTGSNDIFISKLDANGNFSWAGKFGSTIDDIAKSIVVDSLNNIYTTGGFRLVVDFDPGPGVSNLNCSGYIDGFIHKMTQQTLTTIKETSASENLKIYPNPTSGILHIVESNFNNKNSLIEIYNCIGEIVYSEVIKQEETNVDLTNYTNGIYFMKIVNSDNILFSRKLIKE